MTVRHRTRAGCIAAFALAATLGGCVAQPPAPTIEKQASAEPSSVVTGQTGEAEVASAPAETPEAATAAIIVPAPEKLLGMERAEIVQILGQPSFHRRDVPALLLRYRDAGCILDLFLYPPAAPGKAGDPTVEHVEARGIDGGRIATKACIESVMKSRAAKAPG